MRLRLIVTAVALVAAVVVAVVRNTDDGGSIRLDAAMARGDLAEALGVQTAAAKAWRSRATRDDRGWAGTGRTVEVLWAGTLADEQVGVVLKAGTDVRFLTRDDPDDSSWNQRSGVTRPGIVAFDSAVLVPQDAAASFYQAQREGAGSPPVQEDLDGLWTRGDTPLPQGALLLAGVGAKAVFTGDVPVIRDLAPEVAELLASGDASRIGGPAQRLVAAVRAGAGERATSLADRVELIAEGTVEPFGPVTVVGTRVGASRPSLSAGVGEERVAGEALQGIRLGGGDPEGQAPTGPGFGAAYVRQGESGTPYLLVAGEVVRTEVRTGTERLGVPAPLGAIPARWFTTESGPARLRADTAIQGRTAAGSVAVPDVAPDLLTVE